MTKRIKTIAFVLFVLFILAGCDDLKCPEGQHPVHRDGYTVCE